MNYSQQQFLELLRSGLWGIPANTELFKDDVDWAAILRVAMQQSVQVIVADGIETLPREMWPPKDALYKLIMVRIKTEQMHQLLNSTLNQIVNALQAENIPSVLLKGQGVAQNYRKPTSRMCGDIDIYVGAENYTKSCEIIKSLNPKNQDDAQESDQHMHLEVNDVIIEVHRITSTINQKSKADHFAEWAKLSTIEQGEGGLQHSYDNQGVRINLPESTFNAFFILYHAVRHMFSEGVGFRQICDWAMFLYKHHHEIDSEGLKIKLREYRLEQIWEEFSILAHKIIGLNSSCIPFYPSNDTSETTSSLTEHIFISGNFGHHDINGRDQHETKYFKRKWRSFRFQTLRLIKLFKLFPTFTVTFGWGWFSSSIVNFLKLK